MRGKSTHHSFSLSALAVSVALALTACGGGGGADEVVADAPATVTPPAGGGATPPAAPGATPPTTPVSSPGVVTPVSSQAHVCAALPAVPAKPASVLKVTDFGARGDDGNDDTPAIEAALKAAQPGQWIVFPAGRYLHSKSIKVTKPGVVLWSEGATLHATNVADQAVWLEADGASVYNFTLTAVTDKRRTTPWESRISIFGGSNPRKLLKNNVIRNNRVVNGGEPGTPLANASGSAGIFVYNATQFLIAENTVARSLADAIHITAGSFNGRVLKNTVKEPGDDLIAVVSYVGAATLSASQVNNEFETRKARDLVRDILVANNDVAGNYWGRGITVVGGESVTIENNRISKTYHSAGMYFARELSYLTFGVKNVLARNNTISDVQNLAPSYVPTGFNFRTTGHGGVEIYSHMFADEATYPKLVEGLSIQNIRLENNVINRVKTDGVRIGNGTGRNFTSQGRAATGGKVGNIALVNTQFNGITGQTMNILMQPSAQLSLSVTGSTDDGAPYSASKTAGSAPTVTGANVTCG